MHISEKPADPPKTPTKMQVDWGVFPHTVARVRTPFGLRWWAPLPLPSPHRLAPQLPFSQGGVGCIFGHFLPSPRKLQGIWPRGVKSGVHREEVYLHYHHRAKGFLIDALKTPAKMHTGFSEKSLDSTNKKDAFLADPPKTPANMQVDWGVFPHAVARVRTPCGLRWWAPLPLPSPTSSRPSSCFLQERGFGCAFAGVSAGHPPKMQGIWPKGVESCVRQTMGKKYTSSITRGRKAL